MADDTARHRQPICAPRPGKIDLTATASRELDAAWATVRVTIAGQSYVFGNEALTRAAEVRDFVADLRANGFDESAVDVVDVQMELSAGKLVKASRASYTLEVTCRPPARLPALLGCVAAATTADLGATQWHFGDLAAVRDELSERCLADLRRRADRIADVLGVPVVGLDTYAERFTHPGEAESTVFAGAAPSASRMSKRSAPLDLMAPVTPRARAAFTADATFRTGKAGGPNRAPDAGPPAGDHFAQ